MPQLDHPSRYYWLCTMGHLHQRFCPITGQTGPAWEAAPVTIPETIEALLNALEEAPHES